MRRHNGKAKRNTRRPLVVELADQHPDRAIRLPQKTQEIIELTRKGMTSTEIGERLRMKAPAVRQRLRRARFDLKRNGRYSSFIGLLVSLLPINKGSTTTAHAQSSLAITMTGLIGAGAVVSGIFSIIVPIEPPVRSEVATIHATTPASTGVAPFGSRRVVTGNDKLTATRPASAQARSSATTSAPSAVSPLPQVSVPARGHAQLSPDLTGGVLGTQDASAGSPAGKLIFHNKLETTGPTTAWRACTRVDAPTCQKANTRGASLSRSEASLPGS